MPLLFSAAGQRLNYDLSNHDTKVGDCIEEKVTNKLTVPLFILIYAIIRAT